MASLPCPPPDLTLTAAWRRATRGGIPYPVTRGHRHMFFILRHGETQWNVEGRMQGGLDSPLTDRGRRQALRQGDLLRQAGVTSLPVHSSPQGRALETARIALPGKPVLQDPRLREVAMGAWQGRTMDEIAETAPGLLADPHPFLWKFEAPGGETFDGMIDRVRTILSDLRGPAIIVTHGVTSQLIRGCLMGLDPEAMGMLPDRQGIVYRIEDGNQTVLDDR